MPLKIVKAKKSVIIKVPEEIEYNTALINEELLHQYRQQLQNLAIQAADKEQQAATKLIVRIEEEQSGVKDKKMYIVELNNNNGTAEVKPLVILNKKVKALSTKAKLTDAAKKTIAKKRRTA